MGRRRETREQQRFRLEGGGQRILFSSICRRETDFTPSSQISSIGTKPATAMAQLALRQNS